MSIIETSTELATTRQALVEMGSSREVAEIQSQLLIAKKFRRDEKVAYDKIMNACQRKGLAEVAVYEYAKGGQAISGPSIRLAETVARYWGNLQFGVRELEQRPTESTVEAFAHDLETNVRCSKVFQVSHVRQTKTSRYTLTDPREIYENVANAGARRVRACIIGVVPGDVFDDAVAECERTMEANVQLTPERIKAMVDKFATYSVTKEMIEARIQRRIEVITPGQFLNMMRIFNSLKDGMSGPQEWFAFPEQPKIATSDVNEKLKAQKEKAEQPEEQPKQ